MHLFHFFISSFVQTVQQPTNWQKQLSGIEVSAIDKIAYEVSFQFLTDVCSNQLKEKRSCRELEVPCNRLSCLWNAVETLGEKATAVRNTLAWRKSYLWRRLVCMSMLLCLLGFGINSEEKAAVRNCHAWRKSYVLEKLSLHVLFFMPNTFWYGIEANDLESACLVFHA